MKLRRKDTRAMIRGDKRQRFPYVLEAECTKCGAKIEIDFSGVHYLSEPTFESPKDFEIFCGECEESSETIKLVPRIILEIVEE
jgi:hypothetical protein